MTITYQFLEPTIVFVTLVSMTTVTYTMSIQETVILVVDIPTPTVTPSDIILLEDTFQGTTLDPTWINSIAGLANISVNNLLNMVGAWNGAATLFKTYSRPAIGKKYTITFDFKTSILTGTKNVFRLASSNAEITTTTNFSSGSLALFEILIFNNDLRFYLGGTPTVNTSIDLSDYTVVAVYNLNADENRLDVLCSLFLRGSDLSGTPIITGSKTVDIGDTTIFDYIALGFISRINSGTYTNTIYNITVIESAI